MNTSGDRLKALLLECGLTSSDFAAQRSVTPQHVNNWFKRGVPLARLDELADLFCVNRQWLRSGEGPKHPSPLLRPACVPPTPRAPRQGQEGRQLSIPMYGVNQGVLVPLTPRHLRLPARALQALGVLPRHAIGLDMPDTNMAPLIPADATLVIDCNLTRVIDGHTYALLHGGRLRVHSLSLGQQGTLCLHSHDRRHFAVERYTQAQCQAQDIRVLGWVFWWSFFCSQRPE